MRFLNESKRLALLMLACSAAVASAQQPGSVEYNTVFLPGHGAGDTTRPSSLDRWGALASGDGKVLGFIVGTKEEAEAKKLALADCVASGGKNCKVVTTFVNECVAVAAKPGKANWASDDAGPQVLDSVKAQVMKMCGDDCKIVRQGCAEARH
jgi:hypothetical protein